MKTVTLTNGAVVCSLSDHEFKCSDGSLIPRQDKDTVDEFTMERKFSKKREIAGMEFNETKMILSQDQLQSLKRISDSVDVVVIPFPMLTALRELGEDVRDQYASCAAYNATKETQRLPPDEKIVDINNWSY